MIRKRTFRFKPCLEALEDRCLLSAGLLDPTFGSGGLVTTDISHFSDDETQLGRSLALQQDSKLVEVGSSIGDGIFGCAIVRYNPDGSLDSTFGNGGRVIDAEFGPNPTSVAMQADGKMVVAGFYGGSLRQFEAARYNADGSRDTSFGSLGLVTGGFDNLSFDECNNVAIQGDGKIVLAGFAAEPLAGIRDFAVLRLNSDGSLDSTFGTDGKETFDFGIGTFARANDVAVQADDKIVLAGSLFDLSTGIAEDAVARLNPDGSLDTSFDGDGRQTIGFGGSSGSVANSVALQSDGKIILAGSSFDPDHADRLADFAVARLNSNGSLDASFGAMGEQLIDFGSSDNFSFSVALDPSGKIVVAGVSYDATTGNGAFALTRLDSDGTLDKSFGTHGLVTTDFGSIDNLVTGVVVQADGNIVAAGFSYQGVDRGYDFALARYQGGATAVTTQQAVAGQLNQILTESVLSGQPQQVTLEATTPAQYQTFIAALASLNVPSSSTGVVHITLNVSGNFTEGNITLPTGFSLLIEGTPGATFFHGGSPALTLTAGDLRVENVTFDNSTDAPTILVAGGHLTLRNDVVQESTGYNQTAVRITAGSADLGTRSDPGGNVINVNGTGTFFSSASGTSLTTSGDRYEINGKTLLTVTAANSMMLVGNIAPAPSGSVNGTPFTRTINYTTPWGDQVIVNLRTAATASSPAGKYAIIAALSGAAADRYLIDPAASQFGTMYVVSLGADPSVTTGPQTASFWSDKRNAAYITGADLAALDDLNLVTQGGSAFDPKSVAQLQAWLSAPPNATAAYQLAVQLAVLELNVMKGYVKATDLVFVGQLLPYASSYGIIGLTSGGFSDVQHVINDVNDVLGRVRPGAPSGSDANMAYETILIRLLQAINSNADFVLQELAWDLVSLYQRGLLS